MTTPKVSRIVFFQELAKNVHPSGSIGHVAGTFLQELKMYLNFSDNEIATLFGVSRPAIVRKRNAAETEPIVKTPTDNTGEMTFEDFLNADLPSEKELEFLKMYGRKMLQNLPENSQARMTLYKLLIEHNEKKIAGEVENDKANILLFLQELKQGLFEIQERLRDDFKTQIRKTLIMFFDELDAKPEEDPVSLRDAFLSQIEAFEVSDIAKEVFLRKPYLRKVYEDHKTKHGEDIKAPPSLVGGGVVSRSLVEGEEASKSKPGGAQYRQAKRRAERDEQREK